MGQEVSFENQALVTGFHETENIEFHMELKNNEFVFFSNNGSCKKLKCLIEYAIDNKKSLYFVASKEPHIDLSWNLQGSIPLIGDGIHKYRLDMEVIRNNTVDNNAWGFLFGYNCVVHIYVFLLGIWVNVSDKSEIKWSEDNNSFQIINH